ncbi:hypothetical protein ACFSL4_20435 [Streptomyces caeni]|uniref:Uncharacterized protein n=1 Tax=Streptomyces caeni TaxID=2307231 RepID=A0ABW4IT00_9ACTN
MSAHEDARDRRDACAGKADEKPSWLFGSGATTAEKVLVYTASVVGCTAFAVANRSRDWGWGQWLFGLLLVWDVVGGVVANGLDPVKRFYHSPLTFSVGWVRRFLHHPVGFAAGHIHPIVVALVFTGSPWWWGPLWYLWCLGGVACVEYLSPRIQLPVALTVVACGVMIAPMTHSPQGMSWFPAIMLLKLVLAHGVPDRALISA